MRVTNKYADIPYELCLFRIEKAAEDKWNVIAENGEVGNILASYSTFEAAKQTMIDIQTAYSRGIKVFKIKEEN